MNMSAFRRTVAAAAFALFVPVVAIAAPEATPWPKWEVHNEASNASIDHGGWDRFLKKYAHPSTDGIVRVAYGQVTPEDKQALAQDLERMTALPISTYNRIEQRAYWIDLYNEITVKFVLDHYPIPSIKDTAGIMKLFASTPWSRKLVTVEGEELSLDDIEHRILRPVWHDPRIHYALNCASMGCPNLQPLAYTAANTDTLLEQGARSYVNHPRGARVENGQLKVSSIYVWYKSDFGGTDAAVISHLKRFAEPTLAAALSGVDRIADHSYDWSLNELVAQ